MTIEGIRERQRLSVMRKAADQIAYDHHEKTIMKIETQKVVLNAHPALYDSSVGHMPDGWASIISTFFANFYDLGEDMMVPGQVRFEREASGLKAFVWTNPEMQWPEKKAKALVEMQSALLLASQRTCEWCGQPAGPVVLGDRVTFYLCEEDGASAREKLAAKVQAFDERVRFRGETSILFQEHSNVWLHVGDINTPILRKALLDIKKIVVERDLIGKVYVTKIKESEGQLFISARADKADPASQFEIAEIIKNAEWQSDQASLAANRKALDDGA